MGRWTFLQIAFTLFITTAPMWLDRAIANDSAYAYLLSPPYIWQLCGITVAIVFIPQITLAFANLGSRTTSTAFYASYQLVHKRRLAAALYFPVIGIFFVALASFIHGTASYAFSVAREVKHHRELGRQNLVRQVNDEAKNGGEASNVTLQRILQLYPDDIRNGKIERRLDSIKAAKETSKLLLEKSNRFAASKQDRLAIEFARASIEAWPYNHDARKLVDTYRLAFTAMEADIKDVFIYCNSPTSADLSQLVSNAHLLFRDARAVVEMIEKTRDPIVGQRLRSQVCSDAQRASTADHFVKAARTDLFGETP